MPCAASLWAVASPKPLEPPRISAQVPGSKLAPAMPLPATLPRIRISGGPAALRPEVTESQLRGTPESDRESLCVNGRWGA